MTAPPKREASDQMTSTQIFILLGLGFSVFCVLGALVFVVIRNRDTWLGPPPQQVVVEASPAPTPSITLTPSATPPPTATSTPLAPTPTATWVVPPDEINREKINDIVAYVVSIRGLEPLQDVPSVFLTQEQLRERLAVEYTEERLSSALDRDRELYIALDLLDPTSDFGEIVLDSAAEGIAGFYTSDEKAMYLIAESVNMFASEEIVYAHEYTHALQDQHFGLDHLLEGNLNADQAIAARALVEGDATLVMSAYQYSEVTNSELEYMAYRASFVEREVIDAVSPSLGVLTFFPYVDGSYFVYTLWIEGGFDWSKVNAAYRDPPTSSEQVMHPEKYLVRDAPQTVSLPDLAPTLGEGWQEIDRDVMGEIGLLAWLMDHLERPVAAEGAAGWDGDAYTLWYDGHEGRVLVVKSVWDAPGEAAQFFETYVEYITLRSLGVPQLTLNESGRRIWEYEGRATFLARSGDQALIILAPDRATLDLVRGAFPEF
jgi:hypothetical protein